MSIRGSLLLVFQKRSIIASYKSIYHNQLRSQAAIMPQFVCLRHTINNDIHWDLMFQHGDILSTWQINMAPEKWHLNNSSSCIPCKKIFDHRLKYLDYKGPISDNRGLVSRIASGTYQPIEISAEKWHITLKGDIDGEVLQTQISGERWQIILKLK